MLGLAETGCLLGVGGRHVTPELKGVEGLFGEGVNEDVVLTGVETEGLFGEGVNEDVVLAGVGAALGGDAWTRGALSALLLSASAAAMPLRLAASASAIAFLRAFSASTMAFRRAFSAETMSFLRCCSARCAAFSAFKRLTMAAWPDGVEFRGSPAGVNVDRGSCALCRFCAYCAFMEATRARSLEFSSATRACSVARFLAYSCSAYDIAYSQAR